MKRPNRRIKNCTQKDLPSRPAISFFGETITALRYQAGHRAAIDFNLMIEQLVDSGVLTMLRVTEAIEDDAGQIFTKYHDQDFSWVDCTSLAIMKREKLQEAFTQDHHFRVMGFITHS